MLTDSCSDYIYLLPRRLSVLTFSKAETEIKSLTIQPELKMKALTNKQLAKQKVNTLSINR